MNGLLLAWMVEIAIVTYKDVKGNHRPPVPSELLDSFVVFGAFSIVAEANQKLGTTLGWGIVVATLLNVFPLTTPTTAINNPTTVAAAAQNTQNLVNQVAGQLATGQQVETPSTASAIQQEINKVQKAHGLPLTK